MGKRRAPAGPGTLEHFKRWCNGLILDTGDPWELEPFQVTIARDVLAGTPEVWTIIPEGNGKTTFMAGFALYHGDTVQNPFVPIGASSREQAEVMYRQAEGFVDRSPSISERFKCLGGYRRIICLGTLGRIQVYAANDATADGVIPTLALVDELHRHRDLALYRTWRGKIEKRGGQILTISTAGEPGSEFEDTRAFIRKQATQSVTKGCYTRAVGEGIVIHDWAVPEREKCDDMKVVKQANPRKAITVEGLRRKRNSPTMTDEHWQRFVCNIATREEGQAITPKQWDGLAVAGLEADPSGRRIGGLDLGWVVDNSALVVLNWVGTRQREVLGARTFAPPVDEADVVAALLDAQEEYSVDYWVFDPNSGGRQMAQLLEKGEHPLQVERGAGPIRFVEHGQDNAIMALAADRLDEAVRNCWIQHDGHPGLRAHVLNAVRHSVGAEKWKYDRPVEARNTGGKTRRRFPIDGLTALVLAHTVAVAEQDVPEVVPMVAML